MKPPPGLELTNSNQVWLLQKSLYGLKEASRQWHANLSSTLRDKGYNSSKNGYSLFYKHSGSYVTFVVVYVADILWSCTSTKEPLKTYK